MITNIILIIGVTLCFLAVARATAIGVRTYRATRSTQEDRYERTLKVSQIADKIVRESDSLILERRGWRGWKPMTVFRIVKETEDCTSFYLKDADDQPLPPFFPGQYITVGIEDGEGKTLSRCYSLSDAPDWRYYRITVKRVPNGKVSNLLHQRIQCGATLQVRAPAGKFVPVNSVEVPLVLIAAGIGITPMVSVLQHTSKCQPSRSVHLFYQVRDLRNAPLLKEVAKWASMNPHVRLYLYVSQPGANPPPWIFGTGRLTAEEILRVYGSKDAQFMFCGPGPMLLSIQQGLISHGVKESMVTVEAFEAIQKLKEAEDASTIASQQSGAPCIPIRFEKSKKNGVCDAKQQTLLEVGEALGVNLESGCRSGDCGACLVKLLKGKVRYANKPGFGPLEPNQALACVAIPSDAVVIDA